MSVNLGTIKIICRPCNKCSKAEAVLRKAISQLERENDVKYHYEIEKIPCLYEGQQYSANISCAPLIIMDRHLVFAGRIRDVKAVKHTLLSIIRLKHLPLRSLNYGYSNKWIKSDMT